MKLFFLFSLICTHWIGCNAKWQQHILKEPISLTVDTSVVSTAHFHLPYNLSEPAERFVLPSQLREISGLSLSVVHNNWLTAIQDEEGILFYINKNTGELEKETPFYKDGDYEGVEVVGDITYVVKSTGTIYEISNLDSLPPTVQKHNTFLSKENDVEGLCYDPTSNCLLIACKGFSFTDEHSEVNRFRKAIYSFDLNSDKLELNPKFIFNISDIQEFLKERTFLAEHDKLCSYFSPDAESLIFSPSAIAIHPLTGDFYMTSSAKKILMVFDGQGNILHLEKMDKKIHPQPEGLVFDKDGTLYIANEGKEGEGTVLKFKYNPDLQNHK